MPVYPGQKFTVKYGDNESLEVTALSGKEQQEHFAPLFQAVVDAEVRADVVGSVEGAYTLLVYIAGQAKADKMWATSVDSETVISIAQKVLARGRLSEDDEKK